jgi:hypothetical protein
MTFPSDDQLMTWMGDPDSRIQEEAAREFGRRRDADPNLAERVKAAAERAAADDARDYLAAVEAFAHEARLSPNLVVLCGL